MMGVVEKSARNWCPYSLSENLQGLKSHDGACRLVQQLTSTLINIKTIYIKGYIYRSQPVRFNPKMVKQKTHYFAIFLMCSSCIQEIPSSCYRRKPFFYLLPFFDQNTKGEVVKIPRRETIQAPYFNVQFKKKKKKLNKSTFIDYDLLNCNLIFPIIYQNYAKWDQLRFGTSVTAICGT